jgi:hypothetical protein
MKNILLALILISTITTAQTNFKPGYIIVKNQTDTLFGQIDDQNWDINPREILFGSKISPERKYEINELEAFGVNNKDHYRVRKVDLDITPFEINDLKKTSELDIEKGKILALRILLKANMSLLFLKEKNFKEHFFYENATECKELINHKYLKVRDGKSQLYENKMYRAQLDMLFSDCLKSKKNISLEYDAKPLIEQFIKYNDCMGCSSVCYVKTEIEKNIFKFGVVAGTTLIRQKEYFRDYFEDINQTKNYLTLAPTIGGTFSILSKRNNRHNVLTFELLYQFSSDKLLPSKFKSHLGSLQLSAIYKKKMQFENSLKPYYGFGGKTAPNIVSIKSSDNRATDLKTNTLNLFGIGEMGIEIKKISLAARLNIGVLSNQIYNLNYSNVAEAQNTLSTSRIAGQVVLGYGF